MAPRTMPSSTAYLEVGVAIGFVKRRARCGHFTKKLAGLVISPRHQLNHATHQRQPRPHRDDVLAQPPVRGLKLYDPLPNPQANPAGSLQEFAGQRRLASLDGVTHGRHRIATPTKGLGNPPVDGAEALRVLPEQPPDAVLAHQRMQPPAFGRTPTHRLQQPDKHAHGLQPALRVGAFQDFVKQCGIHQPNNPISRRKSRSSQPRPRTAATRPSS